MTIKLRQDDQRGIRCAYEERLKGVGELKKFLVDAQEDRMTRTQRDVVASVFPCDSELMMCRTSTSDSAISIVWKFRCLVDE
jgi:hypothetical protein